MKVAIRGKNIEVTDALRAYIEKRLSKLTRYFDDELNAQAVLSVVKDKSTIELTCFVDKIVLRGVETNDDMYAAIDLVEIKLFAKSINIKLVWLNVSKNKKLSILKLWQLLWKKKLLKL